MSGFKKIPHWLISLLICSMALVFSPAHASSNGTISGQVTSVDGMPLDGVAVSANDVVSVTTNPGGFYTLVGVDREDEGVIVTFSADGFTTTQGIASFRGPLEQSDDDDGDRKSSHKKRHKKDKKHKRGKKHRKKSSKKDDDNDDDDRKSSRKDDDDEEEFTELKDTVLNQVLLEAGATQTVTSSLGGTFSEEGFSVTFTPDSFTVLGNIELVISPIDVSTNEINAAPGDFSARASDGSNVTLESFTMADFTLTQNGQPVNLKEGATAELELLLPENTSLVTGDSRPMWFFDTGLGLWVEEGTGIVGPSTTTAGRLAVFATVTHFTSWNCDQPYATTNIVGRVINGSGLPISGARVSSTGVDYSGTSPSVQTDANGNYCIRVRSDSTSSLTASISLTGLNVASVPVQATSGAAGQSCAVAAATPAPDLVIASNTLSCISGDVLDDAGLPVVDVTVYNENGAFTRTDVNGQFTLFAPANSDVRVFAVGFPEITVTTGAATDACAVAEIRPGAPGTEGTTCLTGIVFTCSPSSPREGIVVDVFSGSGNGGLIPVGDGPILEGPLAPLGIIPDNVLLSSSAPTGADGRYCVDNLPSNILVNPTADGSFGRFEQFVNTGPAGPTCATGGCATGPGIDVFCF